MDPLELLVQGTISVVLIALSSLITWRVARASAREQREHDRRLAREEEVRRLDVESLDATLDVLTQFEEAVFRLARDDYPGFWEEEAKMATVTSSADQRQLQESTVQLLWDLKEELITTSGLPADRHRVRELAGEFGAAVRNDIYEQKRRLALGEPLKLLEPSAEASAAWEEARERLKSAATDQHSHKTVF